MPSCRRYVVHGVADSDLQNPLHMKPSFLPLRAVSIHIESPLPSPADARLGSIARPTDTHRVRTCTPTVLCCQTAGTLCKPQSAPQGHMHSMYIP